MNSSQYFKYLLFLFILFSIGCTQEIFQTHYSKSGSDLNPSAITKANTSDDLFITGKTGAFNPLFLMRTNNNGGTSWIKTYTLNNSAQNLISGDLIQDSNDDLLVAGHTPQANSNFAPFIFKTDEAGDLGWNYYYENPASPATGPETILNGLWEAQNGDYLVTGSHINSNLGGGYFALIMRVNNNGQVLWSKSYPLPGINAFGIIVKEINNQIVVIGEIQNSNEAFILTTDATGGNAQYYVYNLGNGLGLEFDGQDIVISGHNGPVNSDFYLAKIDWANVATKGNPIWAKKYEITGNQDNGVLTKTPNGYLIQGEGNGSIVILKTDNTGDLQWTRRYGNTESIFPVNYVTGHSGDAPTIHSDNGFAFIGGGNAEIFLARTNDDGNTSCNEVNLFTNVVDITSSVVPDIGPTSGLDLNFVENLMNVQVNTDDYDRNDDCRQLNCIESPTELVAWYPFDLSLDDVVSGNSATSSNQLSYPFGKVSRCLKLNGASDFLTIPSSTANNFGLNNFSIEFWISIPSTGSTGNHTILNKTTGSGLGYAISLNNGVLESHLSDGVNQLTLNSTYNLAPNSWHLVSLTIDRANNLASWYVDGSLENTIPINTITGTVSNTSPLLIGVDANQNNFFDGSLDELELFDKVLTIGEIQSIFNAGGNGKCKAIVDAPNCQSMCASATSSNVAISICNYSGQSKTYTLQSLFGLPQGSNGGFCNEEGPTSYTVTSPNVTIASGNCGVIYATIPRPSGLDTPNDKSCFQATIVDDDGLTYWTEGCLVDRSDICFSISGETAHLNSLRPNEVKTIYANIENTTDSMILLNYKWSLSPADEKGGNISILENQNKKSKKLQLKPSESIKIPLNVKVNEYRAFKFYDISLDVKTEGDLFFSPLESIRFITSKN